MCREVLDWYVWASNQFQLSVLRFTSKFALWGIQDGGRPPYLICKNAVLRQQIDRFSPYLTCTRRKFFLSFMSRDKSYRWKFKMAADRHNGFLKNAVIRERIERFSQNLTHTSRKLFLSWGHLNICVVENPRWRPTIILEFDTLP
jgi:hypothetical protein